MHNIILLSSFHKGNSDELYEIIEKIQPEIIFEELSHNVFTIIYAAGFVPESSEAFTIKKYLEKYPIKHFPVDTYPVNEADLFNGADIIWNNSIEYGKLWNELLLMIKQNGYYFLNSNNCIELLDKIKTIEEKVLLTINDVKLSREYKSEIDLNNNRENEMLQNIYDYSKQYQYTKAMFICGVKHKKSIIQKITELEKTLEFKLNWTFYNN